MKRFEYKIYIYSPRDIDSFSSAEMTINRLGSEGWELISSQIPETQGLGWRFIFTFKREVKY